jgi:DNA-binding CsgD family transcriptional regulator
VSLGLTNREIGAHLGITERSAEGHIERIRLRLDARSRAQIAAWWASDGHS